MKRFIMVLLLICLVITPVFGSVQAAEQNNLTARLPLSPIIPITPIIPEFQIPDLLLETNSVSLKTIPLYRYRINFTAGLTRHNYAANQAQMDLLESTGWTEDGIVTYISPIPLPGTMALYKCVFGNWITVLTLYPGDAVAKGYEVRGIVGYVYNYTIAGAEKQMVYRNTRSSSNYLYVDYLFNTSPTLMSFYSYIGPKFKGWMSSKTLQEVKISPVGASQTGNANLALSWTSTLNSGYNELLYSTDDGASYTSIAKNLPNSTTNTYSWKMPNINSTTVRVMVKWSHNSIAASTAWARTAKFSITKDPGFSLYIPLIPAIPLFDFIPASPSNLVLEPGTTSTEQIRILWQDNANNETGFDIERKSGAGSFANIDTMPPNFTSYVDLTVTEGTAYTYRVRATGTISDSSYSNEATATYNDPDASIFEIIPELDFDFLFPGAPTALVATASTGEDKEVNLSWTKPSGTVTGYSIERKTTGDWGLIGTTVTDLVYTDLSVDDSALSAVYRVKAVNDAFESSPSNEAAVVFDAIDDGMAPVYDGTQSAWAEPEISEAFALGLTYPGVLYEFQRKITREEFCVISVKLYEKLTGETALPGVNPFTDTANADILKAYGLGIVNGISADKFAPGSNITRQEMCVMIYRALQAAGEPTLLIGNPAFPYSDKGSIAAWALNAVRFCNQNSIMLGTTPTTISPLMNTPREQAIVLVKRTYSAFK